MTECVGVSSRVLEYLLLLLVTLLFRDRVVEAVCERGVDMLPRDGDSDTVDDGDNVNVEVVESVKDAVAVSDIVMESMLTLRICEDEAVAVSDGVGRLELPL